METQDQQNQEIPQNKHLPPKVWILVLLVVVILFGLFIMYKQKNQPTLSEMNPGLPLPYDHYEPQGADKENWQTYRNEEFGFEVTFGENWDGYKPVVTRDVDGSAIIFCLPTGDKNYPDSLCDEKKLYNGFASIFLINIYTQDQWNQIPEGFRGPIIGQSNNFVFSYSEAQDSPDDLSRQYSEVDEILSTFKFIEPTTESSGECPLGEPGCVDQMVDNQPVSGGGESNAGQVSPPEPGNSL